MFYGSDCFKFMFNPSCSGVRGILPGLVQKIRGELSYTVVLHCCPTLLSRQPPYPSTRHMFWLLKVWSPSSIPLAARQVKTFLQFQVPGSFALGGHSLGSYDLTVVQGNLCLPTPLHSRADRLYTYMINQLTKLRLKTWQHLNHPLGND